jgi:hypothetical protein
MGYYAALSGSSVPTFRDNLSVPSLRVKKSKKKAFVLDFLTLEFPVLIFFGHTFISIIALIEKVAVLKWEIVCGRWPAGIADSNPTGGMNVFLL